MGMTEKVRRILIRYDAPFSEAQMDALTDRDGWAWIYGNRDLWRRKPKDDRPDVCFTGFGAARRAELEEVASSGGLHVRSSVTKKLAFLVTGANAGPKKIVKAQSQGVAIVTEEQFLEAVAEGCKER